jgi:hypothetical protein
LRCDEAWCRNTDLHPTPPIRWPQVDYSYAHWPEDWKLRYLQRLGGKSYQQNLLDRSLADGLDFELDGYTGCTLAAMRQWKQCGAEARDVKLEDVMADFDGAMLRIFDHFSFNPEQSQAALEVARSEDIRRMDGAAIAARPQIHSRTISKWRQVLSGVQIARFEQCHGDLISELGYQSAAAAQNLFEIMDASPCHTRTGAPPAVDTEQIRRQNERSGVQSAARTAGEVGIRLSADGTAVNPTAVSQGTYTFVVPSGRARVLLEPVDETSLGGTDGQAVRVSRIIIRSAAGEVVVAADDPRLIAGWRAAERVGTRLWRCTNGSAELPWADVAGPAVVTISTNRREG